jgi:myosin heavy subunit
MPFFEQGTHVWYMDKREDWRVGVVLSQQAHKLTVQPHLQSVPSEEATPGGSAPPPQQTDVSACAPLVVNAAKVLPVEEGALVEQADMCAYAQLSEPVILQNVHVRFAQDRIYTYVGPILVSVNPYRPLPLYDLATLQRYVGSQLGEQPPHLFALAERAYRGMLREGLNQSVLISGESGAGKTEATKVILQYLAAVSGRVGGSPVERRLLEASPLLEAFGNAKTVRNNNSSRFGKNVLVYFSRAGAIQGAKIVNYLLEKSRIVAQVRMSFLSLMCACVCVCVCMCV